MSSMVNDSSKYVTATATSISPVSVCTRCMICEELIELPDPYFNRPMVCGKCKAAVMRMREEKA